MCFLILILFENIYELTVIDRNILESVIDKIVF